MPLVKIARAPHVNPLASACCTGIPVTQRCHNSQTCASAPLQHPTLATVNYGCPQGLLPWGSPPACLPWARSVSTQVTIIAASASGRSALHFLWTSQRVWPSRVDGLQSPGKQGRARVNLGQRSVNVKLGLPPPQLERRSWRAVAQATHRDGLYGLIAQLHGYPPMVPARMTKEMAGEGQRRSMANSLCLRVKRGCGRGRGASTASTGPWQS